MPPVLSKIDKMILKTILSPNENKTSCSMSKKLEISLTTLQRRRKRLEKEFLEQDYTLVLEKFGWRRVDFFISTSDGRTDSLANDLLFMNQVAAVGKSIGEHTIDLRVETIVKDNHELLDLLEKLKAMDGIRDAVWSEIVKTVGNKMSVPSNIIDRL
jgi:DNA-binding Lrp family transcriptional regulator